MANKYCIVLYCMFIAKHKVFLTHSNVQSNRSYKMNSPTRGAVK